MSGSLEGVLSKEQVKHLIGKDGKHFKRITKAAGVSFIWYNEDINSVSIWGLEENLQTAISLLYTQIEKVKRIPSCQVESIEIC